MARSEEHVRVSSWLSARVGQVYVPGGAEWELLQFLFQDHGSAEQIAKATRARIERNSAGHPHTAFFIGSEWTPKSWASYFTGYRSARDKQMRALRLGCQTQIAEFRACAPRPLLCPVIPGELLGHDAEVDHAPPMTFVVIADAFVEQHGVPEVGSLTHYGPQFLRADQLAAWQAFHREHAVLRWLSKKGNRIAHRVADIR